MGNFWVLGDNFLRGYNMSHNLENLDMCFSPKTGAAVSLVTIESGTSSNSTESGAIFNSVKIFAVLGMLMI